MSLENRPEQGRLNRTWDTIKSSEKKLRRFHEEIEFGGYTSGTGVFSYNAVRYFESNHIRSTIIDGVIVSIWGTFMALSARRLIKKYRR